MTATATTQKRTLRYQLNVSISEDGVTWTPMGQTTTLGPDTYSGPKGTDPMPTFNQWVSAGWLAKEIEKLRLRFEAQSFHPDGGTA